MSQLVELLQETDLAMIEMENAKSALEAAKLKLEWAREEFEQRRSALDQVIAKSDEIGVPRAKLRKLAEERAAALLASGLFSAPANASATRPPKPPKLSKPSKKKSSEDAEVDFTPEAELHSDPSESEVSPQAH